MPYFTEDSLRTALAKLHGTAHDMLKIWFVLKQMGMTESTPAIVDTSSPTPALKRLFGWGNTQTNDEFFIPFAPSRFSKTIKNHAARSIIQTTVKEWWQGIARENNPTAYLDFRRSAADNRKFEVRGGRNYPLGLGLDRDGFAVANGARVSIPDVAFAVWYYRQEDLPADAVDRQHLRERLATDLSLSPAEMALVFIEDVDWTPTLQDVRLTDQDIYRVVSASLEHDTRQVTPVVQEASDQYIARVHSMVTTSEGPSWLRKDPRARLDALLAEGAKAILLYGPPRTSKTYVVDQIISRDDPRRVTIQIHNGWGYEDLMGGLRPKGDDWVYEEGPLLKAIREHKTVIVLEEINRTEFTQAIGEVFSLLEEAYRGTEHSISLRNGEAFFIPEDVLIICTMNTLDRSTEDIDDALFGRLAAVEFPPRVEDLHAMLEKQGVPEGIAKDLRELFGTIVNAGSYPLGHGYFARFTASTDPIDYYLARIRPVLYNHLHDYRDDLLDMIDNEVDRRFA